jgi:hypothetical protein
MAILPTRSRFLERCRFLVSHPKLNDASPGIDDDHFFAAEVQTSDAVMVLDLGLCGGQFIVLSDCTPRLRLYTDGMECGNGVFGKFRAMFCDSADCVSYQTTITNASTCNLQLMAIITP